MTSPRIRFAAIAVISFLACSKKLTSSVEDAGMVVPPASSPEITELAPLTDDAGTADATPGLPKKWTGQPAAGSANQMKVKACCNAMRTQAKKLGGGSPEAFQLNAFAVQCDAIATQIGPQGNAPEFNQIRQMLMSIKLPAACAF
jgi:hypothetical protein